MNLSRHEHYGRLIDYERQKAERAGYKRSRPIRTRKPEGVASEVALNALISESHITDEQTPV